MEPHRSKLPDWGEIWQLHDEDMDLLFTYIKSHDINQCLDKHGNTLLHSAIHRNDRRTVDLLSYLLIDSNIKNPAGQTALQIARNMEARCLVYLHLDHLCIDFDKALTKPNGLDALLAAIYRGDAMLGDTSGVTGNGNEENEGGWTALHCAAMYNRPHLIRELHQRFPNLVPDFPHRGRVSNHFSALHLAAMHGHSDCIIALCECFPAINADDALQAACWYNRSACIPALRKCFPHLTGNEPGTFTNASALMCAARYNNPECIRALHSHFPDIDPNLQYRHGHTALITAASYNRDFVNCLPVLFECFPNIDPNKQNIDGYTALMRVVEQEEALSDCIALFSSYFPNIDIDMQDKYGRTALAIAIEHSQEKCILALNKYFPKMDPNSQDNDGNTPLMRNVVSNQPGYSTFIPQLPKLFPNIDPNKQNNDGNTALMLIMWKSSDLLSVEDMNQFFDTFPNVDVNIQNTQGDNVLMFAIQRNSAPLVALLLERFPHISLTNSTQRTALMLATRYNQLDLILVLLKHLVLIDS